MDAEGEGDMTTAEAAGTRGLPPPNSLRCRLSNGRKWRCCHPVMPGRRFCKNHRNSRSLIFNPAANFKTTKPVKGSPQRPRRRMEGEQIEEFLIRMEQNEKPQETVKLPTTALRVCDNKIKAPEQAILEADAAKQAAQDVDHQDTKPITPARSGVVWEDFPPHPPGFPADSGVVRAVEPATLEGVMETLRRSQEQMEAMRMSQEQGRLQLDELLKDNNRRVNDVAVLFFFYQLTLSEVLRLAAEFELQSSSSLFLGRI
ncbi:hypothetical protein KSP40_PGU008436 [Platanthera guangdongensis]|uniref:WRC domain-containing protein n=1 Tax=Platanthera guangdongensis TaxID=2320717 RepID=A0ABR2MV87_9ASPA